MQTLMDIESLNEFMFPFFSACLLEQRSPHTRVAFTRLQSRGWLAALAAAVRAVGTRSSKAAAALAEVRGGRQPEQGRGAQGRSPGGAP